MLGYLFTGLIASWCHAKGETEHAICAPDQELAEGLRQSIRAAIANHPLLILLDTCEVLLPVLDHALRQLFAPLLHESAPLLILVGSRLRADIHQPRGSKRGWRVEIPQETFSPLDFGEDRRFTTVEIEHAIGTLTRPFTGDAASVAVRLHVATLGIPLAVRGLFDLHEQGDEVLTQLGDDSAVQQPLSEKAQIRRVIGEVAERFLLNLTGRAEREDDLRDIVALALMPRFDAALLARFWGITHTHGRITHLASRYSLLSDGDLHAVVRSYLRLHWREEKARPECFATVLSDLECAAQDSPHPPQPGDQPARLATLAAELNLRSWAEGSRVVDSIARALTLSLVYEADAADLAALLRELPPAEGGSAEIRNLWHRDEDDAPTERKIVPWLKLRRASSREWSAEETAALALLEGITTAGRGVEAAVALSTLESLEKAVTHFGLDNLPRQASAGEAFFDCGHSLDPYFAKRPDWVASSAAAYERAIALHHLESTAWNNVANLYPDLNRPEEEEAAYREAIRLDPKYASPHNGLGWLYQSHLNRPEKAEAAYREAIRLDPKDAYPHNGLGNLYQDHLNRPKEAEAEYREAIRLDPKDANPHHGLGNLYRNHLNRPKEAEAAYREAIRLDPKDAYPHNGLGNLYEEAGRWGEAEVEFRQDAGLDPKSASGQRGLAWVALLARGDVGGARTSAAEAMKVEAAHPGSPLAALAVEAWAGAWPEAVSAFADWILELPAKNGSFPWANRNRLVALLRKALDAGQLAAMAEPIRAVAGRACWRPWSEALEAVLAGRDASGLSTKAAELHALLSTTPTARKR
jgi:tetratricopeptide (TPR) repeat protein